MDWISGLQMAIDYIEENLCGEISLEEASMKACSSVCHFQRVFGTLCGHTVGEYIRLRRLTLAGTELAADKIKVIDAALKYGYDSPDSFTKAFVKFHGITPSRARLPGATLNSFARLSIRISLEGGNVMNYRIEKKPAITVTGLQSHFSGVPSDRSKELHDFFVRGETRFIRYAVSGMARDVENEYYVISGLNDKGYDLTVGGIIPQYFCDHMEKTVGKYKDLLTQVDIPEQTYVVAETDRGINCMNDHVDLRNSIVSQWLPSSGYVLADGPEVVVIHFPLRSDEANPKKRRANDFVEVWLPIVKN